MEDRETVTPTSSEDVRQAALDAGNSPAKANQLMEEHVAAKPEPEPSTPPADAALSPERTERFVPKVGAAIHFTDAAGTRRDALTVAIVDHPESNSAHEDVAVHLAYVNEGGTVVIARDVRHLYFFQAKKIETTGNFYEYNSSGQSS